MKQKERLYSLVGCGVMLVVALLFDWMEAFGQSIGRDDDGNLYYFNYKGEIVIQFKDSQF